MNHSKLILCGLLIAALGACDKYDDTDVVRRLNALDETAQQQAGRLGHQDSLLSDLSNLPTGIILNDETLGDVIKNDTLDLRIMVNPSDFPLKKEHLSLIASHNIFTKIEPGADPKTAPFDESVKSDFEIIALLNDESYDGAYHLKVKVKGEGNYFDDATIWVLAKDMESKENRFTISNTGATVFVLPNIEEGLWVDSPQQSFYNFSAEKKAADGIKPHYFGLWSNQYKNRNGMPRFYDRSKITSLTEGSDEMTAINTLDKELFEEYGIMNITPKSDSEFWKEAIKQAEDSLILYKDAPASLKISRGNEMKILEVPFRSYMNVVKTFPISISGAQFDAQDRKIPIPKSEYAEIMGDNDEYQHALFEAKAKAVASDGAGTGDIDDDGNLTIMSWSSKHKDFKVIADVNYKLVGGQNKDGYMTEFDKDKLLTLLEYCSIIYVKFTE